MPSGFFLTPAILILKNPLCESGFPAAKNRGKMPLTQSFGIKPSS